MKRIFALLLTAVMLLTLCACNDTPAGGSTNPTGTTIPTPTGPLYDRNTYSASDEAVIAAMDSVFGTVGSRDLTSRLLQIAYWTEFSTFVENYGNYIVILELDKHAPLDSQVCKPYGGTWQQYFLNETLKTLHEFLAMAQAADADGCVLPDVMQEELDGLLAELDAAAKEQGFADADALVRNQYGPGCTAQDFYDYIYLSYLSFYYYNVRLDAVQITDQMILDYYTRYQNELNKQGVVQDGSVVYTVRNLLVPVEGEDWDKAETAARDLLDQWLAGEKTEHSFAALAKEHSKDETTNFNGGLMEGLTDFVTLDQAVVDWYISPDRKVGDCELIKTEIGYELVYFCQPEENWHYQCRLAVTNVTSEEVKAQILQEAPLNVDYSRIVLADLDLTVEELDPSSTENTTLPTGG